MAALGQTRQLQCSAAAGAQPQRLPTCPPRMVARPFTAHRRPAGPQQRQQLRQRQQQQRAAVLCAAAAPAKLEKLTVEPITVIEGHVKLPGSKSLTNRILLLAALAEGTTVVENVLVRGVFFFVLCWQAAQAGEWVVARVGKRTDSARARRWWRTRWCVWRQSGGASLFACWGGRARD